MFSEFEVQNHSKPCRMRLSSLGLEYTSLNQTAHEVQRQCEWVRKISTGNHRFSHERWVSSHFFPGKANLLTVEKCFDKS